MNSPTTAALDQVVTGLQELLSGNALAGLSDEGRAVVLRRMGEVSRLSDAVVVESVASADVDFGYRFGCRGMNELLQRALLTDAASAGKIMRAAEAVRRRVSLTSGERLPARWPMMREALLDGTVGIAGLLAAVNPIEAVHDRLRLEDILAADEILARFARGYRDASSDNEDSKDSDGDEPSDTADVSDIDEGDGADAGGEDSSGAADGADEVPGPPATPGELRNASQYLVAVLDQDGAAPRDESTVTRRFVQIGPAKDGLHTIRGNLLPEVAAQLKLIFDAYNNPKVGGAPDLGVRFRPSDDADTAESTSTDPTRDGATRDGATLDGATLDSANPDESMPDASRIDGRDAGQKRHDALAAALGIAARHGEMPTLGGASPTLVVHVDVKDLASGSGWARIPGAPGTDSGSTAFVPVRVAAHTACTGAVQRVLFDEGRIIGITVTDRVFTAHQRKAIILRDTECLIPGCHVPASWCEIHHVTEHARGGPTHTDNGVPLCWWHHRSLDTSGWDIRMNAGAPEIRGPVWWDPVGRWRAPRPHLNLTRTG